MKAIIKGETVNVKVVEDLGCQGGRYAKVVEYNGEEHVVVKSCRVWRQHVPSLQVGPDYQCQSI